MKPKQKDTNPMDEAYKLLEGTPSATGVSDAAKGLAPTTDDEQFETNTEAINERRTGQEPDGTPESAPTSQVCQDIDQAYAMLFEGLAGIMRNK